MRELRSGEQALWIGQPSQGLVLRGSDAFLIPFSLLWCGFAIFWEVSVLAGGGPWFFSLFGVPFVLAGLYFVVGRFWVDAAQRRHTFYAVTSDRIVIVSGLFAPRVQSLSIDRLSDVSLNERSDGTGTITFGPVPPWYWWYGGSSWPGFGVQAVPSFELISDARRIYEVIHEAQRTAR
jgi:hypothetical protein